MASTAIQKFYDAAKAQKARAANLIKKERVAKPLRRVGVGLSGSLASVTAGYVDGRFASDGDDSLSVGPVPVVPVVGGIVAAVGIADVLPGSDYVAGAGFAVLNGWGYARAKKAGLADKAEADAAPQG